MYWRFTPAVAFPVFSWPVSSIAPITSPPRRRPRRAASSRPAAANRRTSLIAAACPRTRGSAAAASGPAYGPRHAAAIVHPFRFGISLASADTYFPACCHVSVRAKHGLSRPSSSARFRDRPPGPYPGSSSRLRFICPHKHMIVRRLRSRHTNPLHPARSSRQWRLPSKQVRLLVTETTSADPAAIKRTLGGGTNRIIELVQVKDEPAAYIHAKWVHLIHPDTETLLTGSANLSRSALLRSSSNGNIEIGVVSTGPAGTFDGLYAHLQRKRVNDVSSLGISYQGSTEDDTDDVASYPVALWSRLDGDILSITFSDVMPEGTTLSLEDHAGRALVAVSTSIQWRNRDRPARQGVRRPACRRRSRLGSYRQRPRPTQIHLALPAQPSAWTPGQGGPA